LILVNPLRATKKERAALTLQKTKRKDSRKMASTVKMLAILLVNVKQAKPKRAKSKEQKASYMRQYRAAKSSVEEKERQRINKKNYRASKTSIENKEKHKLKLIIHEKLQSIKAI